MGETIFAISGDHLDKFVGDCIMNYLGVGNIVIGKEISKGAS